jgi:uncharacterized membrane protein YdjX (TVP38/TMEM64 family)
VVTTTTKRISLGPRAALGVAALVVVFCLALRLHASVTPGDLEGWIAARRAFVSEHLVVAAAFYTAAYVGFAALSLPGAWAISVAGGALFGAWVGTPLVALSSTAGATVAMLAARFLFRDAVAARFPEFVARVDRGVEGGGARWLFAARLTPIIPFSAINLAVGLTRMRATTFALVTLVGVFPLAWLYAVSGAELTTIARPSDILSVKLLVVLFALAAAPFAARWFGSWRARPR